MSQSYRSSECRVVCARRMTRGSKADMQLAYAHHMGRGAEAAALDKSSPRKGGWVPRPPSAVFLWIERSIHGRVPYGVRRPVGGRSLLNHRAVARQHTSLARFTLQSLAALLCLVASYASAQATPGVQVLVRWSTPARPVAARWSPDGREVVYHYRRGKQAVVERFHVERRKRKIVTRSTNGFYPCFGPAGTIFAGPAQAQAAPPSPPAAQRKKPARRRPAPRTRGDGKPTPRTQQKDATGGKAWWQQQSGAGIVMFGGGQKTFLFPGFAPNFSAPARRLLFSYRSILYLWNPLQSRRRGLLLLSRGYSPRWSHDGRAIAWLRKPFHVSPKQAPRGGGIVLVDMLFRAARVTQTGGQVSWAPDNRTLYYVDRIPTAASAGSHLRRAGIYEVSLRKRRAAPTLIRSQAWQPALPVRLANHTKHLLAFADASGVWLMHRRSRKRLLVARGASQPRWSSQGTLLVHYPQAIAVLQISAGVQTSLK